MSEQKPKLALTGAIIILSISILFAASTIANAIRDASRSNVDHGYYQYQLERLNENFEQYLRMMENNVNN